MCIQAKDVDNIDSKIDVYNDYKVDVYIHFKIDMYIDIKVVV